jgi:hypothetical protein
MCLNILTLNSQYVKETILYLREKARCIKMIIFSLIQMLALSNIKMYMRLNFIKVSQLLQVIMFISLLA